MVKQDMERLACLDAIANPKGHAAPTEVTSDERSLIIARCLSQTGEFGSAMARACVEQDLASYEALLAYPEGMCVVCCPLRQATGAARMGHGQDLRRPRILKRSGLWQIDRLTATCTDRARDKEAEWWMAEYEEAMSEVPEVR